METYYLITFFIFGIFLGSFYNVVAYRLPRKMSLLKPSSHCPKCNHKLKPLELIPIFSWVIQGGKCKNCHEKIAIFYPIFECLTGILFALTYKIFGITIDTFIALIFLSAVLVSILSDVLYMVIINNVLIISGVAILILKIVNGTSILNIFLCTLIPALFIYLLKLFGNFAFKKESLGDGDICFVALFGLTLGWDVAIFAIILAAFLALIPAIINLKKTSSHELPFGPFLGVASLIALFFQIDSDIILTILGL